MSDDLLKRVFSAPGFDLDLEASLEAVLDRDDPWAAAKEVFRAVAKPKDQEGAEG